MSDFEKMLTDLIDAEVTAALGGTAYPLEQRTSLLSAIRALEAENAALREANRWIPVTERLPKTGVRVEVSMRNQYVVIASFFWKIVKRNKSCPFDYPEHQWKNDCGQEISNVVKWRPLPPPPEEEQI